MPHAPTDLAAIDPVRGAREVQRGAVMHNDYDDSVSVPTPEGGWLLKLFDDWRDDALCKTLVHVIAIAIDGSREETAEALARRLGPQVERIAALELAVAKLTGAVDVLRGAQPPPPAKFPTIKVWREDTIYYEGDIVTFAGGTFQATKDTPRAPGGLDWVCLAKPGSALTPRGTYDQNGDYCFLDVAMIGGSSFIALKDRPGPCPGDDWQLLASRGSRGDRGLKGERGLTGLKGERGQAAPAIKSWYVNQKAYTITPVYVDDTTGPPLELRPLFEQFLNEVGASE
jgi:hypothetical protein